MMTLLLFNMHALAEEQFTKQNALDDAKLRLQLADCITLPLGKIHINPYNEQARAKFIVALEKAGVIAVKNSDNSTGNVFQDIFSNLGKEVGEGDLLISLSPSVDKQQIEVRFGTQTCLLTGRKTINVNLISYDVNDVKKIDLTSTKVIVAQGTYVTEGNPNNLYAAVLTNIGTKPIERGKFRTIYEYDPFQARWNFRGMDVGEVNEPTFRSNNVERALSQFVR
jgi:hypothetical protein